mgnify:FL=1
MDKPATFKKASKPKTTSKPKPTKKAAVKKAVPLESMATRNAEMNAARAAVARARALRPKKPSAPRAPPPPPPRRTTTQRRRPPPPPPPVTASKAFQTANPSRTKAIYNDFIKNKSARFKVMFNQELRDGKTFQDAFIKVQRTHGVYK